jgi:branched-chain amino acid transport system substrate-binding protein
MKSNTPENFYTVTQWVPLAGEQYQTAVSKRLFKDYVAKHNITEPDFAVAIGYRAVQDIVEGVKRAGSTDTEAVIKALEGIAFEAPTGPYTIRAEDHQGIGQNYVANIGPSDTAPFFKYKEVYAVDEKTVVDPATPGVAMPKS